jgi:hypothetical protein
MAIKIIIRAMLSQISIVLYFSLSVGFLLANAEPIVASTTEIIINRKWNRPKKAVSGFFTPSLEGFQKYLVSGLLM